MRALQNQDFKIPGSEKLARKAVLQSLSIHVDAFFLRVVWSMKGGEVINRIGFCFNRNKIYS